MRGLSRWGVGLGLATVLALVGGAWGQWYPPSGDSRNAVSLRSDLQVGQGPSTITDWKYHAYSFGLGDLPRYSAAAGAGPLQSSMYSGSSFAVPGRSGGAAPNPGVTMVGPAQTSRMISAPMQPIAFSAAAPVAPSSLPASSFVLGLADTLPGFAVGDEARTVRSLVPKIALPHAEALALGEQAMRRGDYAQALEQFEKARAQAPGRPESLLSLAHACLALKQYDQAAGYLAGAIREFPYLPYVSVHPKDFFAREADYRQVADALDKRAQTQPQDASAAMLLGYLRLRDNLIAPARRLLDQAAAHTQDKDRTYAIGVLIKALGKVKQELLAAPVAMGQPQTLAWAGLRVRLPEGFASQPLSNPNSVLLAVKGAQGTASPQTISVSIFPVQADTPLGSVLDHLMRMAADDVAVSGLAQLEQVELDYLSLPAMARLYTCHYMGEKMALVRLGFARPTPPAKAGGPPGRLVYVLGMALLESQIGQLMPTASAFARHVELVDLAGPLERLADAPTHQVTLEDLGVVVAQPEGWVGQRTPRGYEMTATDWRRGGLVCLTAEAAVGAIADSYDAKSFALEAIKKPRADGSRATVAAQGPARLAGLDGYELLVRRTAGATTLPTTTAAASAGMEMARLVCTPASAGRRNLYALIVRSVEADEPALRQAMDKLAAGFRLGGKP